MTDNTPREALDLTIGALADIAFSSDMSLEVARNKAKRIYEEACAALAAPVVEAAQTCPHNIPTDDDPRPLCLRLFDQELAARPQELQEEPKLNKPARVGNATFGAGVATRLVVEAAQRQHEYHAEEKARTPEQWREIERNRRALWDMLNGTLEPDHQELPPLPPRYADPETGHAAIRRDEDLLEWGREIQRQAFEAGKRSAPAVSGEAVAWLVRAKNGMVRACWTYAPDQDQLDAAAFDGDTITPLYAHPTGDAKDAERWRFFRVAGSTVTLRMHNTRPDHRDAAIDAAISGETKGESNG